jgi:apolipoprotein D and lipocalin family protein
MQVNLITFAYVLSFIFLSAGNGCKNDKPENMDFSTVKELDLERYMGTWYEIARFDHSFERGLVGVTANYSYRDDGKIKVVNTGYKNSLEGPYKEAVGKAKQPNPQEEPGKLKVSFFWFFYADYFVFELDEDYQWVLIGSSSDKYLWILSRTPQLEQETRDYILKKARKRGYDTGKLIWVEQTA